MSVFNSQLYHVFSSDLLSLKIGTFHLSQGHPGQCLKIGIVLGKSGHLAGLRWYDNNLNIYTQICSVLHTGTGTWQLGVSFLLQRVGDKGAVLISFSLAVCPLTNSL